jgi:hypothetical protein
MPQKQFKEDNLRSGSGVESSPETIIAPAISDVSIPLVERAKLALEVEKIALERDKLLVLALSEDFKARWQELLNFENENSRWQTLYVTALLLVISWVLTNTGPEGRYRNIADIFTAENWFFLLSLALINAVYTLAMAYKGFQIQEIAQYLFAHIGRAMSAKIRFEFDGWERWRRDEKGQPTIIRNVYYLIVGILPTSVSATILALFCNYQYQSAPSGLVIYFYICSGFVLTTLLLALWTTRMNGRWRPILGSVRKRGKHPHQQHVPTEEA